MRWGAVALACVLLGAFAGPAAADSSAEATAGQPGATCRASDAGRAFTAPGAGVTNSGLGADAPAYYEIGAPSGQYAGRAPKAIMLVIHGGGWYRVGKAVLAIWGRPMANRWRNDGWQTVNLDYRPCADSVQDVVWFMQRVRALHPHAVICATGESAGGHLAMMLASLRSDLACAISHAGPTDLVGLEKQRTIDGSGTLSHAGPRFLSNLAVAAFGREPFLARSSPKSYASHVTARLLLATGQTDPLIPRAQDTGFAKTVRRARPTAFVEVVSLPPGPSWFVHTGVSRRALKELRVREEALVAPLLTPLLA